MANKITDSLFVVTKRVVFDDNSGEATMHYSTTIEQNVIQHIAGMSHEEKVLHINKIEPSGVIKGIKPEFIDGTLKLVTISETANNVVVPSGIHLRLSEVMDDHAHPLFGIRELLNHPQMESWLLADKENPMKIAVALTAGCWTIEE